jgi:hypothetical protein
MNTPPSFRPDYIYQFVSYPDSIYVLFYIDRTGHLHLSASSDRVYNRVAQILGPLLTTDAQLGKTEYDFIFWRIRTAGYRYVPFIQTDVAFMAKALEYLSATEARRWVASTASMSQPILSRSLDRAMKEDLTLWRRWFIQDFPDIAAIFVIPEEYNPKMPYNGIPEWFLDSGKDLKFTSEFKHLSHAEFSENPWRRYYMWTYYLTMKSLRIMVEWINRDKPDLTVVQRCFFNPKITLIDVNSFQVEQTSIRGELIYVRTFPTTEMGDRFIRDDEGPDEHTDRIRYGFSTLIHRLKQRDRVIDEYYAFSALLDNVDGVRIDSKMFRQLPRRDGFLAINESVVF